MPRWLAAGLARWQSLHEDLHATTQVLAELAWKSRVATQVPAQLVGLAAACEWRWSFVRCGPGRWFAGVLGKGLVGAPTRVLPWRRGRPCRGVAVIPGKDLAGGLVDFLGKDLVEGCRLLVLI